MNDPRRHLWSGWCAAFSVFAVYSQAGAKRDDVSAEHDEVLAGPDPAVVSVEHRAVLESLGWRPVPKHRCWARFT